MARGKEAAASALRRYEAAMQVIDRLTTSLTEAKLRARSIEREAARVPELLKRIADLQERLDAICSVEIERQRIRHEREMTDLRERADKLLELACDWVKQFDLVPIISEWAIMQDVGPVSTYLPDHLGNSRTSRRQLGRWDGDQLENHFYRIREVEAARGFQYVPRDKDTYRDKATNAEPDEAEAE